MYSGCCVVAKDVMNYFPASRILPDPLFAAAGDTFGLHVSESL
jgi:hypothetical protein